MQASTSIPTGPAPVAPRFNRRLVTAAVIVVLGHAALITVALLMPPKALPQPKLESTMTVQLISQPAPTPVAVESKPTPQPPKPVDKPKVVPKPVLKPKPAPLPVAAAPSEHAIEAPEPTPAPPAPPAPPT
ncbi:energy transducer TonB, partial [Burkholderia gladioli]